MTDTEIKALVKNMTPEIEKLLSQLEAVFDKAENMELRENTNEVFYRTESLLEYLRFFFNS